MANFICDICGGNIKMQGSQGGVCQNCGMEYDIEAIRAKVNAAPQPKVETPVVAQPAPQRTQQSQEDRDALLIYLNDLRTMETIIHENDLRLDLTEEKNKKMTDEINDLQENISILENKQKIQMEGFKIKNETANGAAVGAACALPIGIIGLIASDGWFLTAISWLNTIFGCICALVFLFSAISERIKYNENKNKFENEKAQRSELCNELKRDQKNKKDKYKKWSEQMPTIKEELTTEKNDTMQMLNQAYSANIIPLQFRNIEGVYYLYDYLSTSNQSLAEALMQANLEAIKQRLEQMIDTQAAIIIEQQQTNARLADLQQTNQNILKASVLTAKYAQVAAVNSQLSVKLAGKQLAYQKADFFLK